MHAKITFAAAHTILGGLYCKYYSTEKSLFASLPLASLSTKRRLDTQRGCDLHCAAPFKNLSPGCTAQYKSEVVD